jgi:hypothetical protein
LHFVSLDKFLDLLGVGKIAQRVLAGWPQREKAALVGIGWAYHGRRVFGQPEASSCAHQDHAFTVLRHTEISGVQDLPG